MHFTYPNRERRISYANKIVGFILHKFTFSNDKYLSLRVALVKAQYCHLIKNGDTV